MKRKDTLFGIPMEQIERQRATRKQHDRIDPEYNSKPINPNVFLEPCINGGKKILNNPEIKEMMHKVYRR